MKAVALTMKAANQVPAVMIESLLGPLDSRDDQRSLNPQRNYNETKRTFNSILMTQKQEF